jgi:hypothetical protein
LVGLPILRPDKLCRDGTKWRVARLGRGVLIMTVTRTNKAVSEGSPDPKAAVAIGRALKAHYADLVQAPLPEKFVELLARFEVADRATDEPKGAGDADANG